MQIAWQATNHLYLRRGKLFPYANQPALYHCPADSSLANGVSRTRSYSMNGWMGSRTMENNPQQKVYRTFVKDSEFSAANAAKLWIMADEHEDTLDDGFFRVDMNVNSPSASAPATRHNGRFALNFADGHVEIFKSRGWNRGSITTSFPSNNGTDPDWIAFQQATTTR
jgi:prepilin-type processing-associated H-X9-DG protein